MLKKKQVLILAFVGLLVYWFCFWVFKKPLVELRFLSCYNSPLPFDSLEVFSNSGCGYSWLGYLIFRPFFLVGVDYYRVATLLFYLALISLNFFVIRKIASLRKVNFILLLFLSVFLLDPFSYETSTIFVSFTLINLAILLFLLNNNWSLFFSGFCLVLSASRPQPLVLFGCLFLSLLYKYRRERKHWAKIISFLLGGSVLLIIILFDRFYIQNLLFNAQLNSGIDWSVLFNFKYPLYFFSFLYLFKAKRDSLSRAYLLAFPVIFWSALTNQPRYIDLFAMLHLLLFLPRFNNRKVLNSLFVLLLVYNSMIIVSNYYSFGVKQIFDGQTLLLPDDTVALSDYFANDDFLVKYNVLLFADSSPYNILLSNGLVSELELARQIDLIVDRFGVNVIAIGSSHYESPLNANISFYDFAKSYKLPFLDHDCVACRHITTIIFNNHSDYELFGNHLTDYWRVNAAPLCRISPFYYHFAKEMIEFLPLPECSSTFDPILILDDVKSILEQVLFMFMFVLLFFLFNFEIVND